MCGPPILRYSRCGFSGSIATIHALYLRSHNGGSYNIDVSLNQFNLFYLSLGQYTDAKGDELHRLHHGLSLRHYDDMPALVRKTLESLRKNRPELMEDQSFFQEADAKWGVEGENVRFVAPCIQFDTTLVEYKIGTCEPGSYDPKWPPL